MRKGLSVHILTMVGGVSKREAVAKTNRLPFDTVHPELVVRQAHHDRKHTVRPDHELVEWSKGKRPRCSGQACPSMKLIWAIAPRVYTKLLAEDRNEVIACLCASVGRLRRQARRLAESGRMWQFQGQALGIRVWDLGFLPTTQTLKPITPLG